MSNGSVSSPPDTGSGPSASGIGGQARQMAEEVKQAAESSAESGKNKGADRLKGVADTVDRVADQVAHEAPAMADWVRKAASELDSVSRNLKDKSIGELLTMGKDFARREPAAFIAASAVAGFALSRLSKSTSPVSSVQPSAPLTSAHPTEPPHDAPHSSSGMAFHPGDAVRPSAPPVTPAPVDPSMSSGSASRSSLKPDGFPSSGKPSDGAQTV